MGKKLKQPASSQNLLVFIKKSIFGKLYKQLLLFNPLVVVLFTK